MENKVPLIMMRLIYFNIILLSASLTTITDSTAQVSGCTDRLAVNYNPAAIKNDGSCVYSETSVLPDATYNISNTLDETSGLIIWNDQLWTHNDNDDINIYSLDTLNGSIIQTISLTGTLNTDWEEISHDNDFIYIGDFGNNSNGNRTDLKILRIKKISVFTNPPEIDTISYTYSDQTDLTPSGSNNTDFDCEAFIVSSDSIYLFTKQWVNQKTSVYSLPKIPGKYTAKKKSTYDVEGLITGSAYLYSKKLVVLCGYSILLEPFFFLLYDFNDCDFFSGNKRKVTIPLSFHQVEGIATTNGLKYYISNERFTYSTFITVNQKLHTFNLNPLLEDYIESFTSNSAENGIKNTYTIFPNPVENNLRVKRSDYYNQEGYSITDFTGKVVLTGILSGEADQIDISHLTAGLYFLKIGDKELHHFKVIKEQ